MTVTSTVRFQDAARMIGRGLPSGVQGFMLSVDIPGDAGGGTVRWNVNFNPDLGSSAPFVMLTELSIADNGDTDDVIGYQFTPADWEFPGGMTATMSYVGNGAYAGGRLITPAEPLMLGRVLKGTDGTFQALKQTNTDARVYYLRMRGILAAEEFVWNHRTVV